MSDQKLSQLPTTTALSSTDKVYAIDGLVSSAMTVKAFGQHMTGRIDVVRDFDAVGDDATNNDAAFAAAEAERVLLSHQKVHVRHGTFLLTTAPDWDTIEGPGFIKYNGDAIPAGDIVNSVTLNVPGTFTSLASAWDYLLARSITRGALVTVQVADGTHSSANAITLNHPQGSSIQVLGNQTTPANCILRFTHSGAQDGIRVTNNHCLGFFNGFQIDLPVKAVSPNVGSGIIADTNASIIGGSAIRVINFYFGATGRFGGHIRADSLYVEGASDSGILGYMGGSMNVPNSQAINVTDGASLGVGINAESNGSVLATGASASGCNVAQILSFNDGHLRTGGVTTGEDNRINIQKDTVVARGDNANINVVISPKGTGRLQLKTGYVPGALTSAGSIEIVDTVGTVRKLMIGT